MEKEQLNNKNAISQFAAHLALSREQTMIQINHLTGNVTKEVADINSKYSLLSETIDNDKSNFSSVMEQLQQKMILVEEKPSISMTVLKVCTLEWYFFVFI